MLVLGARTIEALMPIEPCIAVLAGAMQAVARGEVLAPRRRESSRMHANAENEPVALARVALQSRQSGLMSATKLPIPAGRGPSRRPVPEGFVLSDGLADLTQAFDFRSSRFGVDAQTLARVTGRSVPRCRQELFIAEGDMALAYEWLVHGYADEMPGHGRH